MKRWEKIAFAATLGLSISAFADNPISTYHYLADPSAAADDSTFYILTDVDDYSPQKNYDYDIVGLNAFTSQDMKNWTDHGMVFRSKREFGDYPNNTWASGIAVHKGRIYIVYPNGASGVGMLTATSIDGPYTDPVKETHGVNYIAASYGSSVIGGCDGIAHCFDPGIFIEDDGTGYVIFGGGENGQRPYGNNLDIIKFTENNGKITIDKNSLTRVSAQNSFEAPYIHKKGSKYYLSFNTPPQVIDYGMADKITGPYTFVGTVIPGISSVPDAHNEGGNNHQGFAEFQGKWYAVYHDRRLVTASEHPGSCTQSGQCTNSPNKENHRSVSIDELTWNGDRMNKLTFTREGPKQIKNFDPYKTYKALTSSKQRNVRSRTDWTKGKPVVHVLTPLASKESWIRVSGVDFGAGAKSFRVTAASVADGNKVEIHSGSVSGTLAGTCELKNTGGWNSYEDNECEVTGLSGVVDQLFLVFKGSKDSTMGLIEWKFAGEGGSSSTTQTPHGGVAAKIPGKIEVENYDDGGTRHAYNDADAENQGDANVRTDEGVDLVAGGTGVAIGYTKADEWIEFTVDVEEDGEYPIKAYASSGAENSSFCFLVDGKAVGDTVKMRMTAENDWSVYEEVSAGKATLTKGPHEIRLAITGDKVNVDWFSFGEIKAEPLKVAGQVKFHYNEPMSYQVFSLTGAMLGKVDLTRMDAQTALKAAGFKKGIYMLKQAQGSKKFLVNTTK